MATTQIETVSTTADKAKLAAAVVLAVGAIVAFYLLARQGAVVQWIALLVGLAVAVGVFGADRVEVVPRLDDAIDAAIGLAEEEGDLGGAGVLITGSIFTVAEARALLRKA